MAPSMADEQEAVCDMPPLLMLPAEMLHRIFAFLPPDDVLVARKVCMQFANAGAKHMLEEVLCVYHRARLQRLIDIAHHETLSKQVKKLYFNPERFRLPPMSRENWERERSDCRPWREYNITHELPPMELGVPHFQASDQANHRFDKRKRGTFTRNEVDLAYQTYLHTVNDQQKMDGFATSCLTTFFQSCPRLEEVSLAIGHGSKGQIDMSRTAYKDCMCFPSYDQDFLNQGVDQFFSLCNALHAARIQLRRLTIMDVTWRIMPAGICRTEPILSVMQNLHEFRLSISCCDDELLSSGEVEDEADAHAEAVQHIRNGELGTWLAAAPHLRVLKLFPYTPGENHVPVAHTKDIIGSTTWSKLRELGLSCFNTTEDELIDLLLRHKVTLRRLSLSHINLEIGTWESFFNRMGGKLPKLRKLKLRHYLMECGEIALDFDVPGAESHGKDPVREAFTAHMLYGGELPSLEDLMEAALDMSEDEDADMIWDPNRISEADAGYTTDGSVVSYGSDDLDANIRSCFASMPHMRKHLFEAWSSLAVMRLRIIVRSRDKFIQ